MQRKAPDNDQITAETIGYEGEPKVQMLYREISGWIKNT